MSHVRILSENAQKQPNDRISKRYDQIMKELDALQKTFFDTDVQRLHEKVINFFENEKNSPFPVVAHIMPPQDLTDALPFIEDLKKIEGVDFIDHQIHHIQSNRIILFHCTPPPADVPRVRIFEKCFEYNLLFEIFISQILCFCFRHGISPDPNIVGVLKSILFDRYPSFTFLFTIIKQSLFEFISSKTDEELAEIMDYNDFSQFQNLHTMEIVPYSMIIMLRDDALRLTSKLLMKVDKNPFLLTGETNYTKITSSELFGQLRSTLNNLGDDYLIQAVAENGGRITELPKGPELQDQPKLPPKTRMARARQLRAAASKDDTEMVSRYIQLMNKLFIDLDPSCPNYMPIVSVAAFNPRKAITSALADPENKTDTAIAYQILQESQRTIGAAEWMREFSRRTNLEDDKAVALSRFQVAVSELEYLGYTDQRSRRNGGFRHLIRV